MTLTRARRFQRSWFSTSSGGLLALIAALGAVLFGFAPAAVAVTDDDDDVEVVEEYEYTISGFVRALGEPLPGVDIEVTGGGFASTATTDENGGYRVGIPDNSVVYSVVIDLSTVPAGVEVPEGFSAEVEATFGTTKNVPRNFTLGGAERNLVSFGDQLAERVVNGLNFGLMLALAAVGLSLLYGTTGIANFAHAEMVTFGALMAYFFSTVTSLPIWLAIPIAVAVSALFGLAMDAGLWRPLRRRGTGLVQLMIVSIGLSLALRYVFQMSIGGGTVQLPGATVPQYLDLGPLRVTVVDLVSMATSVIIILIFAWWLLRTRVGRATRAVSDNPSLAAVSGIDVDAVVRVVWVLSAALAGLAGVLWAYFRPGIKWDMGAGILLLIFAAVTLGGLGTAFGAFVGSIIVGLLVEVSTLWIPSDLKYVGALGALIIILLFRPQGILGRRERIG